MLLFFRLKKKVYLYNRKERELKTPVILVYSKNIAKRIKKRPKLFLVVFWLMLPGIVVSGQGLPTPRFVFHAPDAERDIPSSMWHITNYNPSVDLGDSVLAFSFDSLRFEGERRICSAIGGGFSHMEWDSIDASQDKAVKEICDELFPLCRICNLQCSPSGMNNPYNKN